MEGVLGLVTQWLILMSAVVAKLTVTARSQTVHRSRNETKLDYRRIF